MGEQICQILETRISQETTLVFFVLTRLSDSRNFVVFWYMGSRNSHQTQIYAPIVNRPCTSLTKLDNGFMPSFFTPANVAGNELNENAHRVLDFVKENPGCHIRKVKKSLNLSMGTVQYHLDSLEEMGKIVSEKQKFRRFYFLVGSFGDVERNILKILNQDSAREILLFIIERKNPTQTDISEILNIAPGTANWHLRRLEEYGIINEKREGKFRRYSMTVTNKTVVNLLREYHPSKWDKWSNRLAELFLAASPDEAEK